MLNPLAPAAPEGAPVSLHSGHCWDMWDSIFQLAPTFMSSLDQEGGDNATQPSSTSAGEVMFPEDVMKWPSRDVEGKPETAGTHSGAEVGNSTGPDPSGTSFSGGHF